MTINDIAPRRAMNPDTKRGEGEHALIFGLTGFGKSYLVARLASLRTYTSVHDAKGTFHAPNMRRFTNLRKLIASDPAKTPRTIYAPDRKEIKDEGAQNAYFEYLYTRGNTTAIVDELTAVATSRHDVPPALFDLYARGREFGNEVWGLTQEPSFIPSIAITQARNRYSFYVAWEPHQKKVVSVMPGLTIEDILDLDKQQFHFYREGEKTIDPRGPFRIGKRALQVRGVLGAT